MLVLQIACGLNCDLFETGTTQISVSGVSLWNFYLNPSVSDVILVVEGKPLPASRMILAMQSFFFEALFFGNCEEGKQGTLIFEDIELKPFEVLLKYMYSGVVIMPADDVNSILNLCSLAHFLGINAVVKHIEHYLLRLELSDTDAVATLNKSVLFDFKELENKLILRFITQFDKLMQQGILHNLSELALSKLLDNENWELAELYILGNLEKWFIANPNANREGLLRKIRLYLIPAVNLIRDLRPKKFFSDDEILNSILERRLMRKLHAGLRKPKSFLRRRNTFGLMLKSRYNKK